MAYETGGEFDIENYYSQYEDLNNYKCSYCKQVLESDDDCQCGDISTLDKVEQLFNGSIYSNKSFITVIPNSLLDKILSFYINFKKLLSNKKNYNCLVFFKLSCCNITGHICCFQKLLALRGNFYTLISSGLQFYLWKLQNVNYYNRGISFCCPFKLQLQLPQSELDKYKDLLITVEVVDEFLLMSAGDTPDILNSISDYFINIIPDNHTHYYNPGSKKYFFYFNKLYDSDDHLETLGNTKENFRDNLIEIFKEFLACENVYIKYVGPTYYQVSRESTFGQELMSMEDINFTHNNLINNITENYILTDNVVFDSKYIDIIYELEQIKFLNVNLEYLQKTLLLLKQVVNCNIKLFIKDSIINSYKIKLEKCINNTLLKDNFKGICLSSSTNGSLKTFPVSYVYFKYFGILPPTVEWNKDILLKLRYISTIFKNNKLNPFKNLEENIDIIHDIFDKELSIGDDDCPEI